VRLLLTLLLASGALATGSVLAVDCDCKHWPWPKECKDTCNARLLNEATKTEMTKSLKIPATTADKIIEKRKDQKLKSIEDLYPTLTKDELDSVKQRVGEVKVESVKEILGTGIKTE
jgi:hypothetical protein